MNRTLHLIRSVGLPTEPRAVQAALRWYYGQYHTVPETVVVHKSRVARTRALLEDLGIDAEVVPLGGVLVGEMGLPLLDDAEPAPEPGPKPEPKPEPVAVAAQLTLI